MGALLPVLQDFEQFFRTGQIPRRAFRLYVTNNLLHDTTINADRLGKPIDILPLQAEHFGNAKPKADCNEQHRSPARVITDRFEQFLKLLHGKTSFIVTAKFLPPQWSDVIGEWPLQPASYLVTLLAKAEHAGFEGQVGYFFLAVVLQWLIYSAAVYLLLAICRKKRDTADAVKEISNRL
jgi:hypothetical protein